MALKATIHFALKYRFAAAVVTVSALSVAIYGVVNILPTHVAPSQLASAGGTNAAAGRDINLNLTVGDPAFFAAIKSAMEPSGLAAPPSLSGKILGVEPGSFIRINNSGSAAGEVELVAFGPRGQLLGSYGTGIAPRNTVQISWSVLDTAMKLHNQGWPYTLEVRAHFPGVAQHLKFTGDTVTVEETLSSGK